MIDFACKRFDLKEVIKCSMGLTRAEIRILDNLLHDKGGARTTEEVARALKLDLSTVQRGVKRLREKGLVRQSQRNLTGGGYEYAYRIAEKQELRRIIMEVVHGWAKRVDEELARW